MTFGELQTDVRNQLNDAGVTFYSNADIQNAINEGYAELADATEFYERHATLTLLTNRTYYDLTSVWPDTILSVRHVYNPTTGQWLEPTDPTHMDRTTVRQWETTPGAPSKYFIRGHWWLGIWPKPSTDTARVRVYGTSIPSPMTSSSDLPTFPREFHPGLSAFALSDLFAQQRETAKALFYWKLYLEYQARLLRYVEGRQLLAQEVRL